MPSCILACFVLFFFNDTAPTEIYTLSLHDALPIFHWALLTPGYTFSPAAQIPWKRSEEHTSELQSHSDLVCRLLLEKKKGQTFKLLDTLWIEAEQVDRRLLKRRLRGTKRTGFRGRE